MIKETHWFEMNTNKDQLLQPLLIEDIELVEWVSKGELASFIKNSYENIIEILRKAGFISE